MCYKSKGFNFKRCLIRRKNGTIQNNSFLCNLVFCWLGFEFMDSFAQIFLEANQRICSRNHFFSFKYKSQEYKVLCKEILYFESKARQINIHVRDGNKYVFNGKLSEVEKGLSSGKVTFLRIHQSYLVNYLLIKSRSKSNVTLINGEVLPISEDRQKEFSKEYGRLLRGDIYV